MVEPPIWKIWSSKYFGWTFKNIRNHHLVSNIESPNFVPFQWLKAHLSSSVILFFLAHGPVHNLHLGSARIAQPPATASFLLVFFLHFARLWHNSETCGRYVVANSVFRAKTKTCKNIVNHGSHKMFLTQSCFSFYRFHRCKKKRRYSLVKSLMDCLQSHCFNKLFGQGPLYL